MSEINKPVTPIVALQSSEIGIQKSDEGVQVDTSKTPTTSTKFSKLMQAAQKVELEEILSTSEALIIAADEIATDLGFPSPLKNRPIPSTTIIPLNSNDELSWDLSASVDSHPKKIKEIEERVVPTRPKSETEEDVNALFQQMNISMPLIKPSEEIEIPTPRNQNVVRSPKVIVNNHNKSADLSKSNNSWNNSKYHERRKIYLQPNKSSNQSLSGDGYNHNMIVRKSKISASLEHSLKNESFNETLKSLLPPDKQMLFLRMKSITTSNSNKADSKSTSPAPLSRRSTMSDIKTVATEKSSIDRLLRPKSTVNQNDKAECKYGLYDELENCTFHPKIHKYRNSESKSNDNDKSKSLFYDRQDAMYKSHINELNDTIGKTNYDKFLTQKFCPNCHSKQSYDEVKERRKKCSNCNIDFCSKLSWNKISNKFFKSQENFIKKLKDKKENLIIELENESKLIKIKSFNKKTGKIETILKENYGMSHNIIWTDEIENDFFDRLNEFHEKKQEKLKLLENEINNEKYPFEPNLSYMKSWKNNDNNDENNFHDNDSDDDENKPSFQAFLRRYYEDLEKRQIHIAERKIQHRGY